MKESAEVGRTFGFAVGVSQLFFKGEVSLEPFLLIFKKAFLFRKQAVMTRREMLVYYNFFRLGTPFFGIKRLRFLDLYFI
jgi:hypothetical protein